MKENGRTGRKLIIEKHKMMRGNEIKEKKGRGKGASRDKMGEEMRVQKFYQVIYYSLYGSLSVSVCLSLSYFFFASELQSTPKFK